MKKLFRIIRFQKLPMLILLICAAFAGCASQKSAQTQNDSNRDKTSVPARTPVSESESSRVEQLESYDSEKPDIYEPGIESDSESVTKANFEKIKVGMSYAEAVKIFGVEGLQTSTMKVNGRETTIFKWAVPDFSKYIDLHFENDKVIEKKQKGLL